MDERKSVEVRVGGRRFRVVSSSSAAEVQRLAGVVEARITAIAPGRGASPEALILTAMSFAQEAEELLRQAMGERTRVRGAVAGVMGRVTDALGDDWEVGVSKGADDDE